MTSSTGIRVAVAVALTSLGGSLAVSAQQLETRVTDNAKISAASCAAVVWEERLLVEYPRIANACQEVVISDGTKWARFTGKFLRINQDGSIVTTIDNRRGLSMGQLALMPAPEQRVLVNGRMVRFSDLPHGRQLDLYMAEGRFAVAMEPGAPVEQAAQIVSISQEPVAAAAPSELVTAEPAIDPELADVLFTSGRADLRLGTQESLNPVVTFLNQNPGRNVQIEGHTDDVGSNDYNDGLSLRRANSVRSYLIEHGIASERITASGKGEHEPVTANTSASGRQQNRRAEMII
jgi:outer membrane protein OmpA-like peptidoglycan-associated protein